MLPKSSARPAASLIVAMMSLLLAACLFVPGKFTSSLDVRRDGSFTFAYSGELHFLALSRLAQANTATAPFEPGPCSKAETGEDRPCTSSDLANQKEDWERDRKAAAERGKREAQSMKSLLGGIDMSDPRAGEELAARLRRQAGWRRVDYKGNGLFDVDFQMSGRLDRDFAFPTLEQSPMANPFVQVSRRNDGTLRIDAPGFGPAGGTANPMGGFGKSMFPDEMDTVGLPEPDGRFTLTTDAEILSNNTDEGPQQAAAGRRLEWPVNLRSTTTPMALVRLSPVH